MSGAATRDSGITVPPSILSRIMTLILRSGFVRVIGMSSMLTGLRILLGIVSTKAIALYAGPAGIAGIGQLQSFIALTNTTASAGISQGISKYVAEYQGDDERRRSILATALALTVGCSLVTAIATFLLRDLLADELLGNVALGYLFVVAAVATFVNALAGVASSALNGMLMPGRVIAIGMIGTVITFALMMVMVVNYHAEGAMLTTIVAAIIGAALTLGSTFLLGWLRPSDFQGALSRDAVRRLLGFALMAIVSGVATPLALLLIRRAVVDQFGIEQAGFWQSVWRISEMYIQAVMLPIANYYVPRLAGARTDREVRPIILRGMALMVPFTALMALTIFLMRDVIISVLYTAHFAGMRELFACQLLGDVFRVTGSMLSMIMVARGMTQRYIVADVGFHMLFVALTMVLMPAFGVIGVTYSFAAAAFVFMVAMAFTFRHLLVAQGPSGRETS